MGGISNGISRFYSIANEKNELPEYFRDSIKLMFYALTVVIGIAAVFFCLILILDQKKWILLFTLVLIYSIILSFTNTLNGIYSAARKRSIVVSHMALDSFFKVVFSLAFIFLLGLSPSIVICGYIFSSIIVLFSQLVNFKNIFAVGYDLVKINAGGWIKPIWSFSWPFSAWGIFTWLQQVSDRWFLGIFSSVSEVGSYSALFQISYVPMLLVSGIFVGFISPILYEKTGAANDYDRIMNLKVITFKLTWWFLILTFLLFIFSLFTHKWVFRFLLSEEYHQISYLMPWMVLSGGLMTAQQILGSRIASILKTKQLVSQQILMSLLAVLLNFLGTFILGLNGLVCAILFSSTLYLIWIFLFSSDIIRKELKILKH
jgi:O-antigen/teichoic acid export membrane protein